MSNDVPEQHALLARARRRQQTALWLLVPIIGVGGPLFTHFGYRADNDTGVGSVLARIVGVSIGIGAVAVFLRFANRRRATTARTGIWSSPALVRGLSRSQRRTVRTAVRRSEPSLDPALRHAEHDAASRAVRSFVPTVALSALGSVFLAAISVDDDLTAFGHVCTAVLAAACLGGLLWTIDLRPRARRYLQADGTV